MFYYCEIHTLLRLSLQNNSDTGFHMGDGVLPAFLR
jgi:hypothetical protein